MKKLTALVCTLVLVTALAAPALASNFYLIPDSNTRLLTRDELWTWQYDALMYIINEIFARYGFHFVPGGKYDNYFRAQTWYKEEDGALTNQDIYGKVRSQVEWENERLAKQVRAEMKELGTTNPNGRPVPRVAYEPPIYGAFSSFNKVYFAANQKLPVYSGPDATYLRAADGKAEASTNGDIYVGGWENGWLMVMYWTNNGNVRVGYVKSGEFKDKINAPMLQFDDVPAQIVNRVTLTDDPVETFQPLATLEAGKEVTYLSSYVNEYAWTYIETTVNGKPVRGFVQTEAVQVTGELGEK
ncbi:hypothetical protein FACS1894196_0520 [Clostridia bacterium]|nr:hypothetical protein FACS1894196_0520 [Clostridia bacterium]